MFENRKIGDIGLSIGLRNCLLRHNINDTYELYNYLVDNNGTLLKMRNIGVKSEREIMKAAPEVFDLYVSEHPVAGHIDKQTSRIIQEMAETEDELRHLLGVNYVQLKNIYKSIGEIIKNIEEVYNKS